MCCEDLRAELPPDIHEVRENLWRRYPDVGETRSIYVVGKNNIRVRPDPNYKVKRKQRYLSHKHPEISYHFLLVEIGMNCPYDSQPYSFTTIVTSLSEEKDNDEIVRPIDAFQKVTFNCGHVWKIENNFKRAFDWELMKQES